MTVLGKLVVSQLIKIVFTVYDTRSSITTHARRLLVSVLLRTNTVPHIFQKTFQYHPLDLRMGFPGSAFHVAVDNVL
jgi:hypothetical protein